MRVAVVGHVEHITLGRVQRLPGAGEIAHAQDLRVFPGGGGGIAFFQLTHSAGEVHLFTALGNDEAGAQVRARVETTGARIHAARRSEPHTRDLVLITPDGERTIVVLGEPLDHAIGLVRPVDGGLLQPVVEEVVPFLQRLGLRRTLLTAAAIVGRITPAPTRRASHPSNRARLDGRRGPIAWPAPRRRRSQNAACFSSTAARRR